MRKYLKGFSNFGYLPVTKNDSDGYTVDDTKYKSIPGGISCSPTDNRESFEIPADDGIWDSGAEWTDTDMDVTIAESELKTIAEVTGADYDEELFETEEGTFDNAPEIALTFSALRRDGGYRLYRYYSARCTGYTVSHQTKGSSNDSQNYTFHFKCMPRKNDGKIRAARDIEKGESLNWIKSFAKTSGGSD